MSYPENFALALEGLVPIAWLDQASRCADHRHPTVEEMFPTHEERVALVDTIVMADTLAVGGPLKDKKAHTARASSLTALAKSIVVGSLVPGGVTFLGVNYQAVPAEGGGVRLSSMPVARGSHAGDAP
jgi:hypothetical protein